MQSVEVFWKSKCIQDNGSPFLHDPHREQTLQVHLYCKLAFLDNLVLVVAYPVAFGERVNITQVRKPFVDQFLHFKQLGVPHEYLLLDIPNLYLDDVDGVLRNFVGGTFLSANDIDFHWVV